MVPIDCDSSVLLVFLFLVKWLWQMLAGKGLRKSLFLGRASRATVSPDRALCIDRHFDNYARVALLLHGLAFLENISSNSVQGILPCLNNLQNSAEAAIAACAGDGRAQGYLQKVSCGLKGKVAVKAVMLAEAHWEAGR